MVFEDAGRDLLGFALANAILAKTAIGVQHYVFARYAGFSFDFRQKFFKTSAAGACFAHDLRLTILATAAIEFETVIHQIKSHFLGDAFLELFQLGILKLDHFT